MSVLNKGGMVKDSTGLYLREIGRIPLLTHEQEIDYGKLVQKMMRLLEAKDALTNKLCREPTVSEWAQDVGLSEAELNEACQQRERAKRQMIEANLRLVVAIAKKYQQRNMEFLDLIQEGTIGLERGVKKFDPTRGYRLSTYVYWWVTQGITRAIASSSRTIRLPIHVSEKLNKIKKAQRQLGQQIGRTTKVSELAAEVELTSGQVRECLTQAQQTLSLNRMVGQEQETELAELLESTEPTPEDYAMQAGSSTDLEQVMAGLTQRQREIVTLRYGLVDGQPKSLAEIGRYLNLSRERVRQVENQTLKQLRQNQGIIEKLADYW